MEETLAVPIHTIKHLIQYCDKCGGSGEIEVGLKRNVVMCPVCGSFREILREHESEYQDLLTGTKS